MNIRWEKNASWNLAVGRTCHGWEYSLITIFRAFLCLSVDSSRGGGYSIYPWVGRCGVAPHTLTLFTTNIADFPTLFKTEFRFLIPCLRHLISIRACKNFAVYRPRKDILLKTKNDKPIPWLRQKSRKHTLAGRTSPLSPYKGVPPPPGDSRSLNLSNMQQLPVKNTCFDVSNALHIASTIVKKHSQIKVNCRRKLE